MTQVKSVEQEGTRVQGGFLIWRCAGGAIVQIQNGNIKLSRGQRVFSNGRMGIPEGTLGLVVGLHEPFSGGLTTDVIEVFWEDDSCSQHMKFDDLKF